MRGFDALQAYVGVWRSGSAGVSDAPGRRFDSCHPDSLGRSSVAEHRSHTPADVGSTPTALIIAVLAKWQGTSLVRRKSQVRFLETAWGFLEEPNYADLV